MGQLSAVVFLPALGAAALGLLASRLSVAAVKGAALAVSGTVLVLSLGLASGFEPGGGYQFVERATWAPSLGAGYGVGVDGIGLLMVLLTAGLTPLALLTGWSGATGRAKAFPPLMLLLETAMLGVFCATDLFLFYVFWEASLIPMYFMIGAWGGPRRIYATVKFFLFTMAGSVLMLIAVLALGLSAGTFDLNVLGATTWPPSMQAWLFWAFFVAFAVKMPVVPVHTWLPDAHVEAPTAGSVILAGVLLKMGGYGMVRFCAWLFPAAAMEYRYALVVLGVAGILYGAGMVMVQTDLKRLIAYSSVSHMGYVVAGLASLTPAGVSGGVLQMVSHGLATGALFAAVGILYERTHSRELSAYGGVGRVLPHFSWALLAVTMASIGLPGTSGFVAEFLVLVGLGQYCLSTAVFAVGGVILGAVYMLSMFRRVMLGPLGRPELASLAPLNGREALVLGCLIAAILAMGVWPAPLMRLIEPDVAALLARVGTG